MYVCMYVCMIVIIGWKSNRVADAAEFFGAVPDDIGHELGIHQVAKKHLVIGMDDPRLYKNVVDVSRTEMKYMTKILNRATTDSKYGHLDKGRMMHVLHFGTKEQQARKDAETTFTADTRDFMEGLEGEILVNFKREWGVARTEGGGEW